MNHSSDQPPFRLRRRKQNSHKGNFGRVLLIGGSRGMAGSISLSSIAALHTGSGLVSVAVPDPILDTVSGFHPAIMTIGCPSVATATSNAVFATSAVETIWPHLGEASAIACGPGMRVGDGMGKIIEAIFSDGKIPAILDADAINWMARTQAGKRLECLEQAASPERLVLTPHPGEFERLSGISAANRGQQIEFAKTIARTYGVTIVLKGGPTVVVGWDVTNRDPVRSVLKNREHQSTLFGAAVTDTDRDQPHLWTNPCGNPGMATAGSGDVLTGIIASLLGQRLTPWKAACLGVWIHGRAGDLAAERWSEPGMTAVHLCEMVSKAVGAAVED